MEKRDVLIIGGGPAGRSVVHGLHAAAPNLSVALIKNEEVNVNRCAVPYGIDGRKPIEKYQIPNSLVTDFGAELFLDTAMDLDTSSKEVRTTSGLHFQYDKLVLATGAKPLIPPIPGIDADNITAVRSLQDLGKLREWAQEKKRAVIIGGGYIGVEVATVLRKMGLDVALVEMLPHILMATTEPEFIRPVEETLCENGIHLLEGRRVVAFKREGNIATAARLDTDEEIQADFFISAIGVKPDTELAEKSGLEVSEMGVITDDKLRASADGVYASGDCAAKKSFVTGKHVRGEFGTNAVFMSRVVAQNLLGADRSFPGVINANASTAFEWALGSAGLTERAAGEAGIDAVCGSSEMLDRYPMMDDTSAIRTKLVFNRSTRKLVGGSVLRHGSCAAGNIDILSLAIQMGATADDLMIHQYATHPELAAKPSDNTLFFAAKEALRSW